MICRVCGMEYAGGACPKCKTPAGTDYARFDYYPNRARLRQTFAAPAGDFRASAPAPAARPAGDFRASAPAPAARPAAAPASVPAPAPAAGTGPAWRGNAFTARYQEMLHSYRGGAPARQKIWPAVLAIVLYLCYLVGVILAVVALELFVIFGVSAASGSFSGDSGELFSGSYEESFGGLPEDEGESVIPNGVSNEEYAQLEVGMTYAEISAIIGGDGTIIAQDGTDFTAAWPGEYRPDAMVVITFEDGEAVEIQQSGLF